MAGTACLAFLVTAAGLSACPRLGARFGLVSAIAGEATVRSEGFIVFFPLAASCRGHDIDPSMSPGLQGISGAFRNLSEETAMPCKSVTCGQQLVEVGPLEIPSGFTRDRSQFALADQPGLFGWQEQDMFLNGGCEQPKNDDLADAG